MGSPDHGLGVGLVGFTFGEEQEAATDEALSCSKKPKN